jgi:glutamine amidotransferase
LIKIVNYGLGNIQAFANIYKRLNIEYAVASSPEELLASDRIILPGVGAFDWAMALLNESGMRDILDELVVKKNIPVLGVCVGMQIMARRSEEGSLPGLGWIDADVCKFSKESGVRSEDSEKIKRSEGERTREGRLSLPHMGWNDVVPRNGDCLFNGLEKDARFYFLHSFYVHPDKDDNILAETDYNGTFACAIRSGNIFGVQFHPEKSHHWGIRLLKNFAEM